MKSFAFFFLLLALSYRSRSQRDEELVKTQLIPTGKCIHCISSLFSVRSFLSYFLSFLATVFDAHSSVHPLPNVTEHSCNAPTTERMSRSGTFNIFVPLVASKVLKGINSLSACVTANANVLLVVLYVCVWVRVCFRMWLCGLIAALISYSLSVFPIDRNYEYFSLSCDDKN